jgi:dipeptidase
MKASYKFRQLVTVVVCLFFLVVLSPLANACTIVAAGKDATVDGSVINSHTADGWFYDSNIRIVRGQNFEKGSTVPVYINLLGDEGTPRKVADIPQVETTYTYFHTGYSCFNEHQLSISESTIGQKDELKAFSHETAAIMTVEQLEIFALQRARTAREAILVMGELAEKYGFLPSCSSQGECLVIADTYEVWVFEIFSVGFEWTPGSSDPGAIWAAQKVPNDEVVVITNSSRIQEIDLSRSDRFMASSNYMEHAIREGWFDPDAGEPFNWQKAYSPTTGYWSLASMWQRERLHYVHKHLCASRKWDPYAETESYPLSFKPDRKLDVQDVMELFRSSLEGTPFNMEDNSAWIVQDVNGNSVKSELATPFPGRSERQLLNISYHRPVAAKTSYSFVSQSRSWMPDWIGGVLWFAPGRPYASCYVPIYAGTLAISESWRNFDPHVFNLSSARWAITLADDLVNRRYQLAIKDLRKVRDPLEVTFLTDQDQIERTARELYVLSHDKGREFVNSYVEECMDKVENAYWQLCFSLIPKYTSDRCW